MYKKSNLYPKIAVGVLAFLMITISMFSFANNVQAIKGEIPVTSPEKEKGPKNPVTPPGKNKNDEDPGEPVTPPEKEKGPKNPVTPPGKNK